MNLNNERRRAENSLTHEDEVYLTYSAFGRDEDWWGAIKQQDPDTAADMLAARVWEGSNLEAYVAKKQESEMDGMSKAQKKRYLRYMKAQKRKKKAD